MPEGKTEGSEGRPSRGGLGLKPFQRFRDAAAELAAQHWKLSQQQADPVPVAAPVQGLRLGLDLPITRAQTRARSGLRRFLSVPSRSPVILVTPTSIEVTTLSCQRSAMSSLRRRPVLPATNTMTGSRRESCGRSAWNSPAVRPSDFLKVRSQPSTSTLLIAGRLCSPTSARHGELGRICPLRRWNEL